MIVALEKAAADCAAVIEELESDPSLIVRGAASLAANLVQLCRERPGIDLASLLQFIRIDLMAIQAEEEARAAAEGDDRQAQA